MCAGRRKEAVEGQVNRASHHSGVGRVPVTYMGSDEYLGIKEQGR